MVFERMVKKALIIILIVFFIIIFPSCKASEVKVETIYKTTAIENKIIPETKSAEEIKAEEEKQKEQDEYQKILDYFNGVYDSKVIEKIDKDTLKSIYADISSSEIEWSKEDIIPYIDLFFSQNIDYDENEKAVIKYMSDKDSTFRRLVINYYSPLENTNNLDDLDKDGIPFDKDNNPLNYTPAETGLVTDSNKNIYVIGNPNKQRYPEDAFSRNIWDMCLYNGRIYMGSGDFDHNTGPVDIYSFAPGEDVFIKEYIVEEEQVLLIHNLENKLVIPGIDPKEPWELGNLYIKENDDWSKLRTLPNAAHCWDMYYLNGSLYAIINDTAETKVIESKDWGNTWNEFALIINNGCSLNAIGDKLCGIGYGKLFTIDQKGYSIIFRDKGLGYPCPSVSFKDGLIFGSRTLYYLPNIGEKPISTDIFANFYTGPDEMLHVLIWNVYGGIIDIINHDNTLYVLCSHPVNEVYENSIYSSADFKDWKCLVEFETESIVKSFEMANNEFYVSIGCTMDKPHKSSGNILKVIPSN